MALALSQVAPRLRLFGEVRSGPTGPEIGALDTYGDPNTMTADIPSSSLAQAVSANTCLVQVEKFKGKVPEVTAFGGPTEVTAS